MRKDLTEIVLIVDRSGSIESIQAEAENGVNRFIDEQKTGDGEANFTLVQFDDVYEVVYKSVPIKSIRNKYKLEPRGMTALLDAVGKTINMIGEKLSNTPEEERPGLVVFAIITDGLENASHEFTKTVVKRMIEHQEQVYNWKFTFLGANQDAFAEGAGMGIPMAGVANYVVTKVGNAHMHMASNVKRMRSQSAAGATVASYYTQEEIEDMEK